MQLRISRRFEARGRCRSNAVETSGDLVAPPAAKEQLWMSEGSEVIGKRVLLASKRRRGPSETASVVMWKPANEVVADNAGPMWKVKVDGERGTRILNNSELREAIFEYKRKANFFNYTNEVQSIADFIDLTGSNELSVLQEEFVRVCHMFQARQRLVHHPVPEIKTDVCFIREVKGLSAYKF